MSDGSKLLVRCPVCGKIGTPHAIANHFSKCHPAEYQLCLQYGKKYKVGWLCRLCGKDFLFITSLYVHIVKEHLGEDIENHINILPERQKEEIKESETMNIVRE